MKKQDKALIISIVIFVVAAIIALVIVLNKGKIFGKSLVSIESGKDTSIAAGAPVVSIESDKEYMSLKDKETATLTVKADGEEVSEGVEYTSSDETVATVKETVYC